MGYDLTVAESNIGTGNETTNFSSCDYVSAPVAMSK